MNGYKNSVASGRREKTNRQLYLLKRMLRSSGTIPQIRTFRLLHARKVCHKYYHQHDPNTNRKSSHSPNRRQDRQRVRKVRHKVVVHDVRSEDRVECVDAPEREHLRNKRDKMISTCPDIPRKKCMVGRTHQNFQGPSVVCVSEEVDCGLEACYAVETAFERNRFI